MTLKRGIVHARVEESIFFIIILSIDLFLNNVSERRNLSTARSGNYRRRRTKYELSDNACKRVNSIHAALGRQRRV